MTLFKGISYFSSDISKPPREDLICHACQTKLTGVKSHGATSWAEAIGKFAHDHWGYACPNSEEQGHDHLVNLLREIEGLHSERLQNIATAELLEKRRLFMEKISEKKGKGKP